MKDHLKSGDIKIVIKRVRRMIQTGDTNNASFIRDITTLIDLLEKGYGERDYD